MASWRRAWEQVIPFCAYPLEGRRGSDTPNAIESLNMQVRKIIKNRGHFPNDEAAPVRILVFAGAKGAAWGKSRCQRPLRQSISQLNNASSPVALQNCPVRLTRHWLCRQLGHHQRGHLLHRGRVAGGVRPTQGGVGGAAPFVRAFALVLSCIS